MPGHLSIFSQRRWVLPVAATFGALALLASATFPGKLAQAQEAPASRTPAEDNRRAEAQKHFQQGFLLGSAKEWEAALREFLTSRSIFPTKSATRNAAVVLRQLGRNAQALELYASLLEEFSPLQPEEAGAIASEMNATQARVGVLEIRANDAGIRVVVDGVQRGVTPIAEAIRLDEGDHTLRLSKDGFESSEVALSVAGGRRQQLDAALKRLAETGLLVVQEASGLKLDAVVDSAVVGKTPWYGNLAAGRHLVLLRGEKNLGTSPSSANIRVHDTTTLTLRAVVLDAALEVEPTPSNASVYLDDLLVGNGVWVGRLPSGPHRVDIVASGYAPFHRDLLLERAQNDVLRARLDPDNSNPLWRKAQKIPFYLEINGGGLISPSLRGGTDQACGCSARSRPLGALAALRVGYAPGRLGLELTGGYMSISSSSTRTVEATGEPLAPTYQVTPTFQAKDYRDSTTLRGPFAALSLAYRMLDKTPLTARASIGLASLDSRTENSGTFSGQISNPDLLTEKQTVTSQLAGNAEATQHLLTPFGSTELRIGYRFSKVFSADIGAALMIFFPPSAPRAGTNNLSGSESRAVLLIPPGSKWSTGNSVIPPVLQLPKEDVAGTFIALSPSIAVRARF